MTEKILDLAAVARKLAQVAEELLEVSRQLEPVPKAPATAPDPGASFNWHDIAPEDAPEGASEDADSPRLTFNGVDLESGGYALPGTSARVFAKAIVGGLLPDRVDPRQVKKFKEKQEEELPNWGPIEGVDATDLADAGWGVIFPSGQDPEIREALAPLLEHRQRQAGAAHPDRFRKITYRPGERTGKFLSRFNASAGPVNPDEIPYYLLIVGGPEVVPYSFEYTLGVDHAVGRVYFKRPEDYRAYAEAVVAAESGQVATPRRVTFFGPRNPNDDATDQTHQYLVTPLAEWVRGEGWGVRELLAEGATQAALKGQLAAGETPGLLFSACHGLAANHGNKRQEDFQGALLCQDWPGAENLAGVLRKEYYFGAADIDDTVDVKGLVAFLYACHGCGTPRYDAFAHQDGDRLRELAPRPFVARLPQHLLKSGALAVIGHVGRAWGWSYLWPGTKGEQLEVFQSTLKRLFAGHPVGWAMEYFSRRYGSKAVSMSQLREDIREGYRPDDDEVINTWTDLNDARAYVVVGDPAVRLPVAEM